MLQGAARRPMLIFIKILEKFISAITILSLGGIFFAVIAQVCARYIFEVPLPWSVEVSKVLFGYLVFIGSAEASLQRTHIAIDPQEVFGLSNDFNRKLDIVRNIAVCGVLSVLIPGAYKLVAPLSTMNLPATGLPSSVMVFPILIGSIAMIIFTLYHIYADINEILSRKLPNILKEEN